MRTAKIAIPLLFAVIIIMLCILAAPIRNVLLAENSAHKGSPQAVPAPVSPAKQPIVSLANQPVPTVATDNTQVNQAWLDKLYQQGYQYYNEELYQKAIDLEGQVVQADPDYYPAYTVEGIALCFDGYFNGGNMKEAEFDEGMQDINNALALNQDYSSALFNKALAYELYGTASNGYYDTALYWYDRTIAVEPTSVWSYYGKAAIYGRRGDVDNTVKYLKQAIDLNPDARNDARTEKDFDNVRNAPAFQSLVGE